MARSPEAYERFARAVDGPMMVITILWLPVLIIPLVTPVHGTFAASFAAIDYSIWALFAVEYLAKLSLAPSRKQFFRTHILDLIIVAVPFFRPARLGRLVNLARLGRVGIITADILDRAKKLMTHKGLHFVLLAVTLIVFASAGLVTIAERSAKGANIHDFGQGLWWAIVTVTTVGYGDKYPITGFGQGVAVALMLVGIGLIGVLTATVASFFVDQKTDKLEDRLERMEALLLELVGRNGEMGSAAQNGSSSSTDPSLNRNGSSDQDAQRQLSDSAGQA
jgi:voltage-gated potassium channel